MPQRLTAEQVATLAPDAQVAAAARGLVQPRKWQSLGQDDEVVWGEHQGSGSNPYQVAVDLAGPTYKCTCPSRKRPCKHVLGLLLLVAAQPGASEPGERPEWVRQWVAGRARATSAAAITEKTGPDGVAIDSAGAKNGRAAARRAQQRESRVQEGVAALERWLEDLVRQGLGSAENQPPSFWETQAARLVDAQAPGLARRLREMAAIPHSGADWPARLLDRLARLHLLLEAFGRIGDLPYPQQEDVRSLIGWNQDQDALREQPGVRDQWSVVAQQVTEEDRLRVQRTWLWGAGRQAGCMVLDFAPPGRPLESNLIPGTWVDAELVFWRGPVPQRALVKARHAIGQMNRLCGYASLEVGLAAYGAALAQNPWIERFLLPVRSALVARQAEGWLVCDGEQRSLPLTVEDADGWRLLALSGGYEMTLVLEWDGDRLIPLSVWTGEALVSLGGAR